MKTDDEMRDLAREMQNSAQQLLTDAATAKRKERDLVAKTLSELSDRQLAALIRGTTNVYDLHNPIRYPGDEARAEVVRRFLTDYKAP